MHADVVGDNVPRCPVRLRLSSLSAVRGQSEDSIAVVPLGPVRARCTTSDTRANVTVQIVYQRLAQGSCSVTLNEEAVLTFPTVSTLCATVSMALQLARP